MPAMVQECARAPASVSTEKNKSAPFLPMVKECARASTSVSTDRSHAPAWERSPGRSGVRLRSSE